MTDRASLLLRTMSGMAMSQEMRACFDQFVGHWEQEHGPLHPPPEPRGRWTDQILTERQASSGLKKG